MGAAIMNTASASGLEIRQPILKAHNDGMLRCRRLLIAEQLVEKAHSL